MINWRTVVGVALLLIGIWELYILNAGTLKAGHSSTSAMMGCTIWIAVGIYMVYRGITTRKPL